MSCPVCKYDMQGESCPVCGYGDSEQEMVSTEWVMLGTIDNTFSADFAREMLQSCDIPAFVISRSGFLGQIGLTVSNFYGGDQLLFEVSVPAQFAHEANEALNMSIGDHWHYRNESA